MHVSPPPSHQIGQRNAMTGSYRHCGSSKKPPRLESTVTPCTTLLPVAESRREFCPLAFATRGVDPHHDLVPFLNALRRNFHVRPVGNAHHYGNPLQIILRIQLPDTPLA